MIIGVCGRKRHGKDTVGRMLAEHFGFMGAAFADPIKRIAMDVYGLTYNQCYGDLKETLDERWGTTPRRIMQDIGESARGIHPETWVRGTLSLIADGSRGEPVQLHSYDIEGFAPAVSHLNRWAITDCRHPNEAEAVRRDGGKILKVVRPGADTGVLENHPSETGVDLIEPDFEIVNNGTLDDLRSRVFEVARKLGLEPINTKLCKKCGQFKEHAAFNIHKQTADGLNSHCRWCANATARRWRQSNKDAVKIREREAHLSSTYGISAEEYNNMLARQGGTCALCDTRPEDRALCVDHCHDTGEIRGLLCNPCNTAMERLDHVPGWASQAIAYKERA